MYDDIPVLDPAEKFLHKRKSISAETSVQALGQ